MKVNRKKLQTLLGTSIGSLLLFLLFPQGIKQVVRSWIPGIAQGMVYIVLSAMFTQKFVEWLLDEDDLSK